MLTVHTDNFIEIGFILFHPYFFNMFYFIYSSGKSNMHTLIAKGEGRALS